VIIDDEAIKLGFFLVGDHGPHHAEIVSYVQAARRLDAGKYTHGELLLVLAELKSRSKSNNSFTPFVKIFNL